MYKPQGSNHALQDYQTQLMLLEEAAKKRKASMKQGLLEHTTKSDPVAATRESKGSDKTNALNKEQDQAILTQEPPQEVKATQVTPMMPATGKPSPRGVNYAEQDYQTQQTKKREELRRRTQTYPNAAAKESKRPYTTNAMKNKQDQAVLIQTSSREFNVTPVKPMLPAIGKPSPWGVNYAEQDYQMQLMLLEQQNKKRILMARQEVPKSLTQEVTVPAAKRRKRDRRSQTSLSTIESGEIVSGSDPNAAQRKPVEHMPPHVHLLYKIACSEPNLDSHTHPVPAFRDAPILDVSLNSGIQRNRRSHLNGTDPVLDFQAFMENETDGVAFVIIRTVECSEASILMTRAGGSPRWTEAVYMKSKILKNAMHQTAKCYFQPDPVDLSLNQTLIESHNAATASFEQNRVDPADLFLFHHRHLLRNYALENYGSKKHIDALLQHMDVRYAMKFTAANNLFTDGLVTEAYILYLFRPNEIVISETYGKPAAFILQEWPELSNDGRVTLSCWSFQADGFGLARKRMVFSIPPIGPNSIKIQDLVAYPLQFATPELRELIRRRGEKQWELGIATQITYSGWNFAGDLFFTDARFMIDHKTYCILHENAEEFRFERLTRTHPFDRMPVYLSTERKPSESSLFVMPLDVYGFNLNERKWIQIFVDCVQRVSWNKKAFERLVLPDQTKDLVRALVTVRASQRGVEEGLEVVGKRTDIISGKEKGLIMLLHGGPGTGKTLTCESIAEVAERPLYRVTCGDMGTEVEAVEKYLRYVLYLARVWNCVLLLDDADAFLEERSMTGPKRDSLISVVLRILNNYEGILILTSKRVDIFDEAFTSRIQVALHYENMNCSTRKKVWQNFLDMLEEDGERVDFDGIKRHLDDLAAKDLNGRQIRNVLTTARQLAISKFERLDWKCLAQALSVSSDFTAYSKRTQGHTNT